MKYHKEDFHSLQDVYTNMYRPETPKKVINEESEFFNAIGDDEGFEEEPSTKEKIEQAKRQAFGNEADEYECSTEGDVRDGEAGISIKVSGHYTAPELLWLLDNVEEMNQIVYNRKHGGEAEVADAGLDVDDGIADYTM